MDRNVSQKNLVFGFGSGRVLRTLNLPDARLACTEASGLNVLREAHA